MSRVLIGVLTVLLTSTGVSEASQPRAKVIDGKIVTACGVKGGSCAVKRAVVGCPTGYELLSGGWAGAGATTLLHASVIQNAPFTFRLGPFSTTGWEVVVQNDGPLPVSFRAVALCTSF
jgi:hypothetical protein